MAQLRGAGVGVRGLWVPAHVPRRSTWDLKQQSVHCFSVLDKDIIDHRETAQHSIYTKDGFLKPQNQGTE